MSHAYPVCKKEDGRSWLTLEKKETETQEIFRDEKTTKGEILSFLAHLTRELK